ncbi:MAG: sensor histidine kinase [Eubacteriales bacterium]
MKLWHKVFLCTLALAVLSVFCTSQLLIQQEFSRTVSAETDRSLTEHSFFSAGIFSKLNYRKAGSGQPFLGDGEAESILVQAAADQAGGKGGMAVYRDGVRIASANTPIELRSGSLLESMEQKTLNGEECRTVIGKDGDRYHIVTASSCPSGEEYELLPHGSSQDHWARAGNPVRPGFPCSFPGDGRGVEPGHPQVLSLWQGKPGHRPNRPGGYGLRLRTGSREFRELSQNVNTMARSVEENVERIQGIADSRKQFIDNLAHEMKTPLTSILGFADLLRIKRTVSDKQRREYSGVVVEEAKRLQTLSGKLMELAVANHAKPDYAELDVDLLFREMGLTMAPLLARRGIRLLWESSGEKLTADRELVKSLLYNLVDNAAKASKEGEEVLLSCVKGEGTVILSVSDWGIGMDEKTVRRATEAFYMADKSRSRKNGGAGLGLALCARIAEMHGAQLRIKSAPGQGTTVFLAFPETPPAEPEGGEST